VLIKQKPKPDSERTKKQLIYDPYLGMRKKPELFKEYDMKTNKIVDVKKKKRTTYGNDSDSED
jgi:hypothetical protein